MEYSAYSDEEENAWQIQNTRKKKRGPTSPASGGEEESKRQDSRTTPNANTDKPSTSNIPTNETTNSTNETTDNPGSLTSQPSLSHQQISKTVPEVFLHGIEKKLTSIFPDTFDKALIKSIGEVIKVIPLKRTGDILVVCKDMRQATKLSKISELSGAFIEAKLKVLKPKTYKMVGYDLEIAYTNE